MAVSSMSRQLEIVSPPNSNFLFAARQVGPFSGLRVCDIVLNMHDEILSFFRTGRFLGLELGMTPEDVKRVIGNPNNIEEYPGQRQCWAYNRLLVRFRNGTVDSYGLNFDWPNSGTIGRIAIVDLFNEQEPTMADVRTMLAEAGIGYEIGRNNRSIKTDAGVWMMPSATETLMSASVERGPDGYFERSFGKR